MRRPIRSPRFATPYVQGRPTRSIKDNADRARELAREHPDWRPIDAIVLSGGLPPDPGPLATLPSLGAA